MADDYAHQRAFLDQHWNDPHHGLWWEQGTGKTRALIKNAELLFRNDKIDGVLIVAAPGGERNWLDDELPLHLSEDVSARSRKMYWRSPKAGTVWHQTAFNDLLKHKGLAWLALAYPAWTTKRCKAAVWKFLQKRRVLFICDEAMSEGGIKTPDGKRSKSICAAGKHALYRRIADGTPVAEGPFDFYAPAKFLRPGYWQTNELYPYAVYRAHFGEYETERMYVAGGEQRDVPVLKGYRNLEELNRHLLTLGSRVLKSEALDLPEKVYMPPARFDLSPQQQRVYDQMRDELVATWEGGSNTAALSIVQLTRLQQIVCGYLPNDDADGALELLMPPADNPRLQLMEEIRDSTRGKTIVWTRYTQDVDMLMDLLGPGAVRYDGKITDDECQQSKRAFQEGDAEWFVATLSKGHTTITLHAAEHVLYYSSTPKLRHRLQSEDRAHRAGLRHVVDYRDVIASGTIDERWVKRLREKLEISEVITGDEARAWLT